jgi:uncharacterized membrane protein
MDILSTTLWILLIIVWAVLVVGWIYTLYQEAKRKQPIWFVLTILIPIVAIIYWIVKGLTK